MNMGWCDIPKKHLQPPAKDQRRARPRLQQPQIIQRPPRKVVAPEERHDTRGSAEEGVVVPGNGG